MESSMCRFHSESDYDWRGEEREVDLGVLGKGNMTLTCDLDKKVLELCLFGIDPNKDFLCWEIPVNYCPVCGKKL